MRTKSVLHASAAFAATAMIAASAHASVPRPVQAAAVPNTAAPAVSSTKSERAAARRQARAQRKALRHVRQARAQQAQQSAQPGDIIVTGIRRSIASAARKKRNAKQIVDSVVSEDVGKLPDNNVPEALARVTGVQISREHGEGSSVSIRGMTDIQTTVNGFESTVGTARSTNLADIPAELLKSVEVYKTRTADQIEGGIAGTVNVELRRPLDFGKGVTVAGSFREVLSSIGNTKSPYASLLVADRFDTGVGEFGFLVNASYTRNHYNEVFVESETPGTFFGTDASSLPTTAQATTIAPYAVNYGVEEGRIERPSINVVGQWKPTDNLSFILEGTYFSSNELRSRDRLHLVIRNGNSNLSNVSYAPSGTVTAVDGTTYQSLQQVTLTPATGIINGGPESYYEKVKTDNYQTNGEVHWNDDHTKIDASAQYNWSRREYYGILTTYRLAGVSAATVDFNSSAIPGGGPYIAFDGSDLDNIADYTLLNFHDERGVETSRQFSGQVDVTHDVSDTSLLRSFQFGGRFSGRVTKYRYGYRDAFPLNGNTAISLTDFVTGSNYSSTTPDIGGFDAPTWYHLGGADLFDNLDAVRSYLQTVATSGDWSTQYPSLDRGSGYLAKEKTFSAYEQLNYGFKLKFPIDGTIGLRVVNTWGSTSSAQYSIVNGVNTIRDSYGRGNFVDLLPSANAIVHITNKIQLRLAYTQNVQRVDFAALSPFRVIETGNANVYAGNPDLKAYTEKSYDASLEYYFGRAGSLSMAAYLKKPNGYIYYSGETEYVAELGGFATVWTNRNAGAGEFRGFEFAGQSFFEFLPSALRNFGASANLTYLAKGKIEFPDNSDNNAVGMSKYTYNLALYYDTPAFSTRIAWNYRSRYRSGVLTDYPDFSPYVDATSRLDAAVNYTPFKFITFSLEGTNLLKNNERVWWGKERLLPQGIRIQARTIQLGARFRF